MFFGIMHCLLLLLLICSGDIERNPDLKKRDSCNNLSFGHWNLNSTAIRNLLILTLLETYNMKHNFDIICHYNLHVISVWCSLLQIWCSFFLYDFITKVVGSFPSLRQWEKISEKLLEDKLFLIYSPQRRAENEIKLNEMESMVKTWQQRNYRTLHRMNWTTWQETKWMK